MNSPMSPLKVFIVDDETPARERLKELLGDIAAEVPTSVVGEARHGVEAVELIPGSDAQIVLLDIKMPAMGGLEVARHLGSLEQPPRIIFVTAHDREFATRFVRIHRNCLVARAVIRGFERAPGEEDDAHWLVQLDGVEEKLAVSRRQWPLVRDLVT